MSERIIDGQRYVKVQYGWLRASTVVNRVSPGLSDGGPQSHPPRCRCDACCSRFGVSRESEIVHYPGCGCGECIG